MDGVWHDLASVLASVNNNGEKINTVDRQIRSKVYRSARKCAMKQVTTKLHRRVDNFEGKVWVEIDKIMIDKQTVLLYTTHTQNHKRGNTND